MSTKRRDLATLTTAELAFLTRRKGETVRSRLTETGVEPVREDGRTRWWDARAALPVLLAAEELDPRAERARLDRARAEREELEVARRRGELLERDDVIETWSAAAGTVKRILRALPKRLAARVPKFTQKMARDAQKVIDEALHELAAVEVGPEEPEGRRAA